MPEGVLARGDQMECRGVVKPAVLVGTKTKKTVGWEKGVGGRGQGGKGV